MNETVRKNAAQAAAAGKTGKGRGTAKHNGCFLNSIYKFDTAFADGITADNLFDARTEKILACQADRLVCTGLFQQHERDDLAQILRLALLHEMSAFTSGGNRYTFASNVAANYGKNLIARRKKERMATNGEIVSLDADLPNGDTVGDLLPDDEARTPLEAIIFKENVALLLSRLDDTDRRICRRILAGESVRDMMRNGGDIGLTRSGIRYRLESVIRPIAIECGLGDFNGMGGDEA